MSAFFRATRAFGVSIVAGCLSAATASADVFNVDSVLDEVDDDPVNISCHTALGGPAAGKCTLRAAVMQANQMPTDSTINLPAGVYYLTRLPGLGANGDDVGDLNLTTPTLNNPRITISGSGAATTIIDANDLDRVFKVHIERNASISGIALRNGTANTAGGVLNEGNLDLSYCTISGNTGDDAGGGILNNGVLTVTNCTVSGNFAGSGAGIFSQGGPDAITLTLNNSTVTGNVAVLAGGGIYNSILSTMFISNSTISKNGCNGDGGGIYNTGLFPNDATWTYNATIAFNEANSDNEFSGSGGGVHNVGLFYSRSSVIMGNTHSGSPDLDDCFGTLKLWGQNAVSVINGACDLVPQDVYAAYFVRSVNGLGPLQFNGGSTPSHALAAGSGLIDGGASDADCVGVNLLALASDQRGGAKGVGTLCDLGAFEFGALPADLIFADDFELGNLWAWG